MIDDGGIKYLNPDPAELAWKIPLRPHLGVLAVMPNNTANYIDDAATGGASTIPPSRFGGNIDDWRIGKDGTMYYKVSNNKSGHFYFKFAQNLTVGVQVELPGALVVVGDTHAAQVCVWDSMVLANNCFSLLCIERVIPNWRVPPWKHP